MSVSQMWGSYPFGGVGAVGGRAKLDRDLRKKIKVQ